MRRTLNVRFLAILLVGSIGCGTGVHFLHDYQVRRNAEALLVQADQVLAKALFREVNVVMLPGGPVIVAPVVRKPDLVAYSRLISHYLALKPQDVEALIKYGLALEARSQFGDLGAAQTSFFVFEKVIRLNPDKHEIRRKLARMTLDAERYQDALPHLKALAPHFPNDPELEQMSGQAHEATEDFEQAKRDFENAIKHATHQIESYESLAHLLRRHFKNRADADTRADAWMDQLIENNGQAYQAYLARARYRIEFKSPTKPDKDIKQAYDLAPQNAEAILAYAEVQLAHAEKSDQVSRQARLDEARRVLTQGLKRHERNIKMYLDLAAVELLANRPGEAKAWLRRGLSPEHLPNQPELLWTLANLLIDEGQDAKEQLPQLEQAPVPPAQVELLRGRVAYLQARVSFNKEKWRDALDELKEAEPKLAGEPALSKQVALLLAQCYGQLGDQDQQYAAYRRALQPDPFWLPACLGMGSTLSAMGKIDEALEIYRRIIPQHPQAMLETARLLIVKNLSLGRNQRRWSEIDNLLERANARFPVDVILLRAETLMAQENVPQAYKSLKDECARTPGEVRLWIGLANLVEQQIGLKKAGLKTDVPLDPGEDALPILDKAEQQLYERNARLLLDAVIPGPLSILPLESERQKIDRVNLFLARAYFLGKQRDDVLRAKKELTRLETQALATVRWEQSSESTPRAKAIRPTPLRWQVLSVLANAHLRLGDRWEAQRLLEQLAEERPKDLSVRLALFDIALEHGLEPDMTRFLEEIQKIEGPGGTLGGFGQVRYLIWQAGMEQTDKDFAYQRLHEAADRLKIIAARRPFWSRVPLAQALIEDARQKLAKEDERNYAPAIQYYLQAIKAGERSQATIRRAFQLLCENGQYVEANDILKDLPDQAILTGGFQHLAAQILTQLGESKRGVSLAQDIVYMERNEKDYRHHLWFAQLLSKAGQAKEQVEKELLRAKELAPNAPEVWVAWILHLGPTKKGEEALKEAKTRIPADKAPLALAQCYEALGQFDQAAEEWKAVLRARPEDPAMLRSVAAFYLRIHDSKNVQTILQKLIDRDAQSPDALWAKQRLAIVLAAEGDYRQSQRALEMLDPNDGTREGLRAKALVLMAQKGHRYRNARQAILALEKIPLPTPDDRFLLAQLHNTVGEWTKARDEMIRLSDVFGESPPFLAYFVKSLIEHREAAAARPFLDRLEKILSPDGTPELAELRASFIDATGNPAAAREYLKTLVRTKPDQILRLVSFVGRQGKVTDALNLCRDYQAWQRCPAEAVANACTKVLHESPATKEDFDRVEEWLKPAMAKEPKAATALTVCLADLRDLQGRYHEAETLYRQALDKEPGNVVALNNLAWLLAFDGQGAEALTRIKQAIEIAGPIPALLDTQGMAYLANENIEEAVKALEQAMEDEPTATYSFHLAVVQSKDPLAVEAVEAALSKAKSLGLKEEQLHALDRKLYQQLKREYPALLG